MNFARTPSSWMQSTHKPMDQAELGQLEALRRILGLRYTLTSIITGECSKPSNKAANAIDLHIHSSGFLSTQEVPSETGPARDPCRGESTFPTSASPR